MLIPTKYLHGHWECIVMWLADQTSATRSRRFARTQNSKTHAEALNTITRNANPLSIVLKSNTSFKMKEKPLSLQKSFSLQLSPIRCGRPYQRFRMSIKAYNLLKPSP